MQHTLSAIFTGILFSGAANAAPVHNMLDHTTMLGLADLMPCAQGSRSIACANRPANASDNGHRSWAEAVVAITASINARNNRTNNNGFSIIRGNSHWFRGLNSSVPVTGTLQLTDVPPGAGISNSHIWSEGSGVFADETVTERFDTVYKPGIEYVQTSVAVVPVPAAAWLFGSGLIGLVGIARRKNPIA